MQQKYELENAARTSQRELYRELVRAGFGSVIFSGFLDEEFKPSIRINITDVADPTNANQVLKQILEKNHWKVDQVSTDSVVAYFMIEHAKQILTVQQQRESEEMTQRQEQIRQLAKLSQEYSEEAHFKDEEQE